MNARNRAFDMVCRIVATPSLTALTIVKLILAKHASGSLIMIHEALMQSATERKNDLSR
jgi:hypothetical protein